jgi:hypothetical protein
MSGAIDSTGCLLTDGTSYAAYALTLPRRGNLQLTLNLLPHVSFLRNRANCERKPVFGEL